MEVLRVYTPPPNAYEAHMRYADSMALMRQYLLSKKNLKAILEAIQQAHAPDRFTTRFLEGLGFKSTSDRPIINVLKGLGFLRESGEPTERYVRFLDPDESADVLGEALREAYSDLFEVRRDAQNMSGTEVKNKMKTLTQGKVKDAVLQKMATTFKALAGEANFPERTVQSTDQSDLGSDDVAEDNEETPETPPIQIPPRQDAGASSGGGSMSMSYRIELVLPPSKDKAVYDALFTSLKEHLLR